MNHSLPAELMPVEHPDPLSDAELLHLQQTGPRPIILVGMMGAAAVGATVVELGSTKRVLAAELGTSSETLSRTLAKLRDGQLLEIKGATLRVRDVGEIRTRFRHLLGEG